MRTVLVILMLLVAAAWVMLAAQGRSVRRAAVINSLNKLLAAKSHFQAGGGITNLNDGYPVSIYTNVVSVDSTNFVCTLAVSSSWYSHYGFLALCNEGTILWIDRKNPPAVCRTAGGPFQMPEPFR